MPLNVLNQITFVSVVVDMERLNVRWYRDRPYLRSEGIQHPIT